MSQRRFDPTLKRVIEDYPDDWFRFLAGQCDLPTRGRAELIDSDVSTVSAAADKVLRVGGRRPWILHAELVASHQHRLARQMLLYNVLIGNRHDMPVASVALLLRPEADRSSLDGEFHQEWPQGGRYLSFRFGIIRLWQVPGDDLLKGGLGLLPLTPIADVAREALPGVLQQMGERFSEEMSSEQANKLWVASYVLMGLQYPEDFILGLFQGIHGMRESSTYQAILDEGRFEGQMQEARKILISLGTEYLGPPDAATLTALDGILSCEYLERLIHKIPRVSDWATLLQPERPAQLRRRRNGR